MENRFFLQVHRKASRLSIEKASEFDSVSFIHSVYRFTQVKAKQRVKTTLDDLNKPTECYKGEKWERLGVIQRSTELKDSRELMKKRSAGL